MPKSFIKPSPALVATNIKIMCFHFKCHLMKMIRTSQCGFLIMTTLKICMACLRKLMVSTYICDIFYNEHTVHTDISTGEVSL
jgi:hypothetical protein